LSIRQVEMLLRPSAKQAAEHSPLQLDKVSQQGPPSSAFAMRIQAAISQVLNAPALVMSFVLALILICVGIYLYQLFCKTGQFFEANGVRLHYVEAGHGTPVILVHGLAFNHAAEWKLPRVFRDYRGGIGSLRWTTVATAKSDKPYDPAKYGLELVDDVVAANGPPGDRKGAWGGVFAGGYTLKLALRQPPGRLLSAAPCGAVGRPIHRRAQVLYTLSEELASRGAASRPAKVVTTTRKATPLAGSIGSAIS